VIDAPPLLPVTDAAVLAQHVGGVVVVVGSLKIKTPDLERSLGALAMVGANVLGIVLNMLPSKGPDAYAYTYYSHSSDTVRSPSSGVAPLSMRDREPATFPGTATMRSQNRR